MCGGGVSGGRGQQVPSTRARGWDAHAHARTRARTHARTHTHMHARPHAAHRLAVVARDLKVQGGLGGVAHLPGRPPGVSHAHPGAGGRGLDLHGLDCKRVGVEREGGEGASRWVGGWVGGWVGRAAPASRAPCRCSRPPSPTPQPAHLRPLQRVRAHPTRARPCPRSAGAATAGTRESCPQTQPCSSGARS